MDIKQRLRNEIRGVSFPLFRITGTSMDIAKLYKQLQKNDQLVGEKISHSHKPTGLQGQQRFKLHRFG